MSERTFSQLLESVRGSKVTEIEDNLKKWRLEGGSRHELGLVMLEAAKVGHSHVIRVLLRTGADVAHADDRGRRALHYASELGSTDVVKQILNAGSPVNVVDHFGSTALHIAAQYGNSALVDLLLNEGAHINRSRLYNTGETPLHLACLAGKLDAAEVLLRRGANVKVRRNDDKTALHFATEKQHSQLVKLLCQAGADVDAQSASGETALMLAAHNGQPDIVNLLVDNGAVTRLQNSNGYTALHYLATISREAVSENHIECAWTLFRADDSQANNANINSDRLLVQIKDVRGRTPLHIAALMNNEEITSLIIACGADLNTKDLTGDSPLLSAIRNGSSDTANILMYSGADVNSCDNSGVSPLHLAQAVRGSKKIDLTALLLIQGAKLDARCNNGRSALDVCVFHYVMGDAANIKCLEMLVLAGVQLYHPSSQTSLTVCV